MSVIAGVPGASSSLPFGNREANVASFAYEMFTIKRILVNE